MRTPKGHAAVHAALPLTLLSLLLDGLAGALSIAKRFDEAEAVLCVGAVLILVALGLIVAAFRSRKQID